MEAAYGRPGASLLQQNCRHWAATVRMAPVTGLAVKTAVLDCNPAALLSPPVQGVQISLTERVISYVSREQMDWGHVQFRSSLQQLV